MAGEKKLYDAGWIVPGILLFLALVAYPLWYNKALGKGVAQPEVARAASGPCILPQAEMRANHMNVLNDWRTRVVRGGERTVTVGGETRPMSLSKTCMSSSCHGSKADFCDRCHTWEAVSLTCFDCHVEPKGVTP